MDTLTTSVDDVEVPLASDGSFGAQPGQTFTISCDATGQPEPTFTWSRDGVIVTGAEDRYTIRTRQVDDTYFSELTVSGATAEDAGSYSCVATNQGSSGGSTVTVEVSGIQI